MKVSLDIPALPSTHTRALYVVSRHDLDPRAIAEVIESDPLLAAALIRAANAAASAPNRRIATVREATVRVGLETTRRIVTAIAMRRSCPQLDRSGIDVDELWQHLLVCAMIADASAWESGDHSEAFLVGLLHDIGRLAMASSAPQHYSRVVQYVRDGADTREAETHVFGFDHCEWGVRVSAAWNLPESVLLAIGDHHDGHSGALSWVNWNARRLAAAAGFSDGVGLLPVDAGALQPEDAALLQSLGGEAGLRACYRATAWIRQAAA